MTKKLNILFIVSEFWQAGTQRFTFEMDAAIDKSKFDITILSLRNLNSNENWEDFYYKKHLAIGSKIVFYNNLIKQQAKSIKDKIKDKITNVKKQDKQKTLNHFFNDFDAISIMGEYNYPFIAPFLNQDQKEKCIIHIMNSIHQNDKLYIKFNKDEKHNFCSGFTENEIQAELKGFSNFQHYFLPLSIAIENNKLWKYKKAKIKKIGVFTRLTQHKPLDPFFYAFQLLLDKTPDVELHIYGTGNPVESGMMRYVKQLNINHKVFFRGHQEDLKQTAIQDDLDLVWFHGYYGQPGGFSGFDICSLGIPQVFWDFSNQTANADDELLPMYNHLSSFVEKSFDVLSNEIKAEKLSTAQFLNLKENRDVAVNIAILQNLYLNISQKNSNLND